MNSLVIFSSIFALCLARPDDSGYRAPDAGYSAPDAGYSAPSGRSFDVVEILKDNRIHPEDGAYSFDIETEDGIVRSESGSRLNVEGNPVGQQGEISFPLPDGQLFTLKFVANEHGFQPESPFLPVAPAFPHPIPQFVLDQIEKARLEDLEADRSGPSDRYSSSSYGSDEK
ncbi:UNVERIFIED_CONTAM: hypothetical protein RMT77_010251 [Armadillidium vulgare]